MNLDIVECSALVWLFVDDQDNVYQDMGVQPLDNIFEGTAVFLRRGVLGL